MSTAHNQNTTDILRKTAIISGLIVMMIVLYRFGPNPDGFDTRGMLVLGFIVLASYTFGELVGVVKLPHITGYLLAGMLLGPSLWFMLAPLIPVPLGAFEAGILNESIIKQFGPLDTLALALIAMTAGGELKYSALKKSIKPIMGILTGQTLFIMVGVTGLVYLMSGFFPFASIDALTSLSTPKVLVMGALVAVISIATSPAATIAVLNDTGATEGVFAKLTLSSVVLKDVLVVVLFSLFGALASNLFDLGSSDSIVLGLLWHVGGSLVIGAALGSAMALYVRNIGVELLLFLMICVFTASFIATSIHLDPALLFIAAGFAATNFSEKCDTLMHTIEKLSVPVYVLFFTLAGARLHLDLLADMALIAALLVAVRTAAIYFGTRFGARLTGAPDSIVRHGWMGFVSQAGVAITLAGIVGSTYGDTGRAIETLIIAGVAAHEIIGPILLKIALGLSGELEGEPPASTSEEESFNDEIPHDVREEWPTPPTLTGDGLTTPLNHLARDLSILSDDLQRPNHTIGLQLDERHKLLSNLRRAFLRQHHHLLARATDEHFEPSEMHREISHAQSELAVQWREIITTHALQTAGPSWSPLTLLSGLNRALDTLPERVSVAYEAESFQTQHDESPIVAIQRWMLRLNRGIRGLLGANQPLRLVPLQNLAKYHLGGSVPSALEGAAALALSADRHLTNAMESSFEIIMRRLSASVQHDDASTCRNALWSLREEIDEAFALCATTQEDISAGIITRVKIALSDSLQKLYDDMPVANSPHLSAFSRRTAKVYKRRVTGINRLESGLTDTETTRAAYFSILGLDLELQGLEQQLKRALYKHGERFLRLVRGRGQTQVTRVVESLSVAISELGPLFEDENENIQQRLKTLTEPVGRVVAEVTQNTQVLQQDLSDGKLIMPLIRAATVAGERLSRTYSIPAGPITHGEWRLPPAPPLVVIPFRQLITEFITTVVQRQLQELVQEISDQFTPVATALAELERVVSFNIDLALAELTSPEGGAPTVESKALAKEMVIGAMDRCLQRLQPLSTSLDDCGERAEEGLTNAMLHDLKDLRLRLLDGASTEVWERFWNAADRGLAEASAISKTLAAIPQPITTLVQRTFGPSATQRILYMLGLPLTHATPVSLSSAFALREIQHNTIPAVYLRLFSDRAMAAGDLLTGRAQDIATAHEALQNTTLRTLAVTGPNGIGKGAIISAITRSISAKKMHKIELTGHTDANTVTGYFQPGMRDHATVIHGIEWLLDGQDDSALQQLLQEIVADLGENVWIISVSDAVWRHLASHPALREVFSTSIALPPLSPVALRKAVLARHSMSAFDLKIDTPLAQLDASLLTADTPNARLDAWFNMLHATTAGIIQDALRLFLEAIVAVDEPNATVHLGAIPKTLDHALETLSDEDLLTLRAIARAGYTESKRHAIDFDLPTLQADAQLTRLSRWSLLTPRDGHYLISEHIYGALHRVLTQRGWK
jgi:Kef-type K+ transport system membrane component KefB